MNHVGSVVPDKMLATQRSHFLMPLYCQIISLRFLQTSVLSEDKHFSLLCCKMYSQK